MDNPERTAAYLRYREEEIAALKNFLSSLTPGEYILELGCGHGHFLTALAEKILSDEISRSADTSTAVTQFAGVDKNPDRIERAQKKSDRLKLPIKWFNANIEDLLSLWPQTCEIVKTFVLFPDPWPKVKHHKNRFVNPELLQVLAKISKKGALFYFRTDHDGYFDAVNDHIKSQKAWKLDTKQNWPVGLPATVFEGHHPRYQSLIATLGD